MSDVREYDVPGVYVQASICRVLFPERGHWRPVPHRWTAENRRREHLWPAEGILVLSPEPWETSVLRVDLRQDVCWDMALDRVARMHLLDRLKLRAGDRPHNIRELRRLVVPHGTGGRSMDVTPETARELERRGRSVL